MLRWRRGLGQLSESGWAWLSRIAADAIFLAVLGRYGRLEAEAVNQQRLHKGTHVPRAFACKSHTRSLRVTKASYLPPSHRNNPADFRTTKLGRKVTHTLVKTLEMMGVAPKGSLEVATMLEHAADGLVAGGKKGIFTPLFFFLAHKPVDA